MKTTFIVISSVLTIVSALPYIRDIIKGKTKPRVVSWFTWSLLTGIATAASFSDGQHAAAILMLFATVATLLIAILGFKHGDRRFERIDVVCQASALVGIVLWQVFNSPELAVLAAVAIDIVGALPTIKHTWQKPHEETWLTFMLAAAGGIFTVLATTSWQVTALVYPLYIVAINGLLCVIIMLRKDHAVAGEPEELREL